MADRMVRFLMVAGFVLSAVVVVAACSSDDGGPDEAAVDSASETSVGFGGDGDDVNDGDSHEGDSNGGEPNDSGQTPADGSDDADDTGVSGETEPASASPSPSGDDDIAAIEAEVERVIQRNWEIWVECTTDIETCDPATALAETESTTSRFYLESVGVVELWKQQGIAYRAVEGREADRFVEIQSIDVSPDLTSAEVLVCDRDDRARFERNGEGEYEMVEGTDFVEDLLLRRVVAEEDGEWRIVDNELVDRRNVSQGIDPLC